LPRFRRVFVPFKSSVSSIYSYWGIPRRRIQDPRSGTLPRRKGNPFPPPYIRPPKRRGPVPALRTGLLYPLWQKGCKPRSVLKPKQRRKQYRLFALSPRGRLPCRNAVPRFRPEPLLYQSTRLIYPRFL